MEKVTVTVNRSALSKQIFSSIRRMFFTVLSNSVSVTSRDAWKSIICWAIYRIIVKRFFKKIRDWSLRYFQDNDKTRLFCIVNLSKLTVCKCLIKW